MSPGPRLRVQARPGVRTPVLGAATSSQAPPPARPQSAAARQRSHPPRPARSASLARGGGRAPAPTPRRALPSASPSPRCRPPLPPAARRQRRRRRPRLRRRRRAGLGSGSAGGRADMAANMYRVGGRKARPDPARLGAGSGSGGGGGSGRVHPNRWEPRAPGLRARGWGGGAGAAGAAEGPGRPPLPRTSPPLPPPRSARGPGPPPPRPAVPARPAPGLGIARRPLRETPAGVGAVEPPTGVACPGVAPGQRGVGEDGGQAPHLPLLFSGRARWGCGRRGPSQTGLLAGDRAQHLSSRTPPSCLARSPPPPKSGAEWGLGRRGRGWGVERCPDAGSAGCLLPSLPQKREIRSNKLSPCSRRPPPSFLVK